MHHFPYASYLRTHRSRWSLSLSELGTLLGVSKSSVAKYEKLLRTPSADAMVAAEFVFGAPARELFPGLYANVEARVALQAVEFAEKLINADDPKSQVKRELLEAIARRAASDALRI